MVMIVVLRGARGALENVINLMSEDTLLSRLMNILRKV